VNCHLHNPIFFFNSLFLLPVLVLVLFLFLVVVVVVVLVLVLVLVLFLLLLLLLVIGGLVVEDSRSLVAGLVGLLEEARGGEVRCFCREVVG
jgi:hypothetical protein